MAEELPGGADQAVPDQRRAEHLDLVAEAGQAVGGLITWNEFERQQPALAETGRRHFYQFGIRLAFLATVRPDDGPRLHPACPVISPAGLHLSIAGPKQDDLRRDGRYALHSETSPPPRQDDGFDEEGIFELGIENFLPMLTQDGEAFPAGPTIWKAGRLKAEIRNAADGRRSDMVT